MVLKILFCLAIIGLTYVVVLGVDILKLIGV